jgi:hypothetical protein
MMSPSAQAAPMISPMMISMIVTKPFVILASMADKDSTWHFVLLN